MDASVVFLGNLALTSLFAALMLAEYFRCNTPFPPVARGRTIQKSLWRIVLKRGTMLTLAGAALVLTVLGLI
jgi:hypothetical protein